MPLRASDIAAAASGRLVGPDIEIRRVTTDTRTLKPGDLFVATRGDRNGHHFIPDAIAQGAAAYLSDGATVGGATGIVLNDTIAALGSIASLVRRRFGLQTKVIGITGSAGKTSTKDLLASILGRVEITTASEKSHNNEIGVPLTIINADSESDSLVLEMGARHVGNIAYLCEFARPNIGVVTNVGLAHVGTFGGVDQIRETKGELVASLPHDGTAILNVMDDNVLSMKSRTNARVLTFGRNVGDVQARNIALDDELRASFRLHTPGGAMSVFLNVRGEHQVMNALAAAAAAYADGISLTDIAVGLELATASPLRMDLSETKGGVRVLNDAYNANPMSMKAALVALDRLPVTGRRFAILGVMAELGDAGPTQHEIIASSAKGLGIDMVSVDAPDYRVADYATPEKAVAALGPLRRGDAVLVKGSRVAGLERAAALLQQQN